MQRKQARARCVVNVVTVVLLAAILIIMNRLAA